MLCILAQISSHFGNNPFLTSIKAKYLIKTGAQIGCLDNHGRGAVHIAAHKGTIKFLDLLAQERFVNSFVKNSSGQIR